MNSLVQAAAYSYARARGLTFGAEFIFFETLSRLFGIRPQGDQRLDPQTQALIKKEFFKLLKQDIEFVAQGFYPLSVLVPESPLRHLRRLPRILIDGISMSRRRSQQRTKVFSARARDFLGELPAYYQRNFHFQTDGYLSEKSAALYEHQVELLFAGAADAMRRMVIPPLKKALPEGEGQGLKFLELGGGTGRTSKFVRLAFPKAKIVVNDLSVPYIKVAQKKLASFDRIDFYQGEAENLPFKDESFDAVYSVFLFHELPKEARQKILHESVRLLKTGGIMAFVDSVQTGDSAAFDPVLRNFPRDFHEPFYANYIATPMEELMRAENLRPVHSSVAFSAKVCWAIKASDGGTHH